MDVKNQTKLGRINRFTLPGRIRTGFDITFQSTYSERHEQTNSTSGSGDGHCRRI